MPATTCSHRTTRLSHSMSTVSTMRRPRLARPDQDGRRASCIARRVPAQAGLGIAGLDPAIHPLHQDFSSKKMDARVKPAHDGDGCEVRDLPYACGTFDSRGASKALRTASWLLPAHTASPTAMTI